MTNKADKQMLDELLEELRLEQTIEDMQAEIEGRNQTTTQAAVDRAMARIQVSMDRILANDEPATGIDNEKVQQGIPGDDVSGLRLAERGRAVVA